jgi:hypothetical protein
MMKKSTGRSGLGSALHDLNTFIFEKNKRTTSIVGTISILIITFAVFEWEASSKTDIMNEARILSLQRSILGGTGVSTIPEIAGFLEKSEKTTGTGSLDEGNTQTASINASAERVIRSINVTLTWTDEPDLRRIRLYENQPDEFEIKILGPEGNTLDSGRGSNPQGLEGSIPLSVMLDDESIVGYIGKGSFTVSITMVDAGDYEPRFGIRTMADNGNDYELDMTVQYFDGSSL